MGTLVWVQVAVCAGLAWRAGATPDEPARPEISAKVHVPPTTRLPPHDVERLASQHAAMAWTTAEEDQTRSAVHAGTDTLFSVIVVESKHHTSNLFRGKERVLAFATERFDIISEKKRQTSRVVSVQFSSPRPETSWAAGGSVPPFFVAHPDMADRRVMLVHITDFAGDGHPITPQQASHLKAACTDKSVTTVLVVADETCRRHGFGLPIGLPQACRANVVRIFPFNTVTGPEGEKRFAYMPLGPRDTFPYVSPDRVEPTSSRPLLFNLQVRPDTSDRRVELINIAATYQTSNPDVNCAPNREKLDAQAWQALLLDSKFTITPSGRNPETFRMWEALESGSIPIVSKLDFTHPSTSPLSTHDCGIGEVAWNTVAASPFAREISVDTWEELPALLDRLREAPPEYVDELQRESLAWYKAAMESTYWSLLDFGQGHDIFPQDGPVIYDQ